eukprot:gnl/TRDRNA2_/TRDRNA2_98361_c1_seq1.p1 gnl/TRDRNA2_/TRDRNA2_98361_c1~~gnl/TRDRNA2_/TRDRNA2_98361_c1_seq1.p1  ORF type:complete len:231 (+),score=36.73 gnl/TRDRNA2_/TRDRNA2_98361_c1_seq1:146-838(+)
MTAPSVGSFSFTDSLGHKITLTRTYAIIADAAGLGKIGKFEYDAEKKDWRCPDMSCYGSVADDQTTGLEEALSKMKLDRDAEPYTFSDKDGDKITLKVEPVVEAKMEVPDMDPFVATWHRFDAATRRYNTTLGGNQVPEDQVAELQAFLDDKSLVLRLSIGDDPSQVACTSMGGDVLCTVDSDTVSKIKKTLVAKGGQFAESRLELVLPDGRLLTSEHDDKPISTLLLEA